MNVGDPVIVGAGARLDCQIVGKKGFFEPTTYTDRIGIITELGYSELIYKVYVQDTDEVVQVDRSWVRELTEEERLLTEEVGGMPAPTRRKFTPLIAQDLVSVQPMSAPVSSIFFVDYKYDLTNKKDKENGIC